MANCGTCNHREVCRCFPNPEEYCCDFEPERPHGEWEYLKECITDMRNADGKLNQKETCQFILNLMGVIEKEGGEVK